MTGILPIDWKHQHLRALRHKQNVGANIKLVTHHGQLVQQPEAVVLDDILDTCTGGKPMTPVQIATLDLLDRVQRLEAIIESLTGKKA